MINQEENNIYNNEEESYSIRQWKRVNNDWEINLWKKQNNE